MGENVIEDAFVERYYFRTGADLDELKAQPGGEGIVSAVQEIQKKAGSLEAELQNTITQSVGTSGMYNLQEQQGTKYSIRATKNAGRWDEWPAEIGKVEFHTYLLEKENSPIAEFRIVPGFRGKKEHYRIEVMLLDPIEKGMIDHIKDALKEAFDGLLPAYSIKEMYVGGRAA